MIDVPADWSGGIEDLVREANRWLARLLPADRAARPKDEVNPRLVRHYTTQGLLPAPRREGRDARYARVHLMALLALRRLMADGLGGKALDAALGGKDEAALERLAAEGALEGGEAALVPAENEAMRFIQQLARPVGGMSLSVLVPHFAMPVERNLSMLRERKSLPAPAQQTVSQITRAVVRPGLELLIGREFQWPRSEHAQQELLQEIGETLRDVSRSQK
ncbi:MerR family transcriptional regulator [Deinococcus marmoris]|uniref:HTH merR-type domain-containing protein n=1 Tax=Deinococcus marmoris TaxID=249408 RepID=A0A1U7P3B0_9DEIO|nr:MerR family transcriptional regulator [Deinococcus marmoris]OLV19663.1 hypothetical protein BOO71_0001999 [Deinococcus marmoris]